MELGYHDTVILSDLHLGSEVSRAAEALWATPGEKYFHSGVYGPHRPEISCLEA
jgi:hypothetical protein